MELDLSIDNESLSITISDPFHLDMKAIMEQIEHFLGSKRVNLNGLDVEGLLPKMVKGIAGCEGGCPADAKTLVKQGFGSFTISYIEGGILSAKTVIEGNRELEFKMFPEF